MARPAARSTVAAPEEEAAPQAAPGSPSAPVTRAQTGAVGALAELPVAGLTRRRIGLLIGSLVAAWVIILFARQVGEASEASARADSMRMANAGLQTEVSALERELLLIQRPEYIAQQAREYRLGNAREIPFVLADDAPPLAADAPGTAAVRLGAVTDRPTPLESWLDLLFGTAHQPRG